MSDEDGDEDEPREPKISGTLYDDDSLDPLPQGTVRIGRYTIAVDTNGYFELVLPKHGTYEIRASSMLYEDAKPVEIDTTDDESVDVEILLTRVEVADPEPQESGDQRYLLAGPSIFLPFERQRPGEPEGEALRSLHRRLVDLWIQAGIGSERADGKPSEPIPPYAPDAIIRGSEVDPGQRVPRAALRSEGAFVTWAQQEGLGAGASIEVDGLLAAPGRPIVSAVERKHSGGR